MIGPLAKFLNSYQRLLVGPFNVAPLVRFGARRLGFDSGVATLYCREAQAAASRGQYDAAVRACRASIAIKPDYMPAYEILVQIFAHVRRYEDALEACVKALEVAPNTQAISVSLTHILPAVGSNSQSERTIALLSRCLAANPGQVEVLTVLVDILLKLRRYREAAAACQRVLEVDPEFFPAADVIRNLLKDPDAESALAELKVAPPSKLSDEYEWLVATNVTDALIEVISNFYRKLGVDPHSAPLLQGLNRFRRKLAANEPAAFAGAVRSALLSFESAWRQYREGRLEEALASFKAIFLDPTARSRAVNNPAVREAVVRSGEIVARHYDTRGDVENAIGVYRDIMSLDQNNLVARRLLLLLSRGGRLREAVEFAEIAIVSRPNLFRSLRPNSYIASLKAEIALKPEEV